MVDEPLQTPKQEKTHLNVHEQDSKPQHAAESVKSHLLFHKALITETDEDEKLDQYMDLVNQLEHGMTIAFPNPFDRAIAITFGLAIEHHLDPWNIDLQTFSSEYLKHVRKDKDLDLVTAGRIILMAWKILKLQSDEVLINAQQIQEQEKSFWHEPDGDWYLNDDDFEYTTEIISHEQPPLQEMVWHKGKRRVSLLELVGALEEAKHEAELIQILNDSHAKEREKLKLFRRQNINTKVHQENLQEDMVTIFRRISKFNGHPIPLSDIYTTELEDKITTLISSLFLAYSRKIDIWQKKFPYGQIFVKNLHNDDFPENVEELENLKDFKVQTPDEIIELEDEDNGGNGKVMLRNVDFDSEKKKKKKKRLEDEIEELVTSRKNIAS